MSIFSKAVKLYRNGEVKIDAVGSKCIYANVGEYLVTITYDNTFSCTCLYGTINIKGHGQTKLCSHILAVLFKIMMEDGMYGVNNKI